MEFQLSLFQILKDDAVKVLPSICQQIWKIQQWPQDWKRSVFIPVPKKGNAKDCSNYRTVVLISHASKVMLKILQARLQQYINWELTDVQFSSVAQLCPTLCDPMNRSTWGLPVHHQLPQSTQTHVHWVSGAIQSSYPLSFLSPPALNLSQHQGLFKWVSSLHQVAKVLEFQLQHQSFQWTSWV